MSGIANSLSSAVSPTTVPRKHRTTSRSRPAARRLSRRSNDGASTRRFSGWELRIAESAGVRVAWPAARPGAASVPTVSHTVTHSARRISYNSESRGVETAPVLLLLHFATPSTIVPSRAESRKGRNLRLPWGLRLSASARLQRGPAYGLRLSACGCRVTWLVGDRRGAVLPTPQSVLRVVYAGRPCVAGAIYLAAAVQVRGADAAGQHGLDHGARGNRVLRGRVLRAHDAHDGAGRAAAAGVRGRSGGDRVFREPGVGDGGGAGGAGGGAAPGPAGSGRRPAQRPDRDRDGGSGRPPAVLQSGGRADPRVQGASVARAAHHAGVREDRSRVLGRDHGDRAAGCAGDARGSHRAAS